MDSSKSNGDGSMIFDHLGVLVPDFAQGRSLLCPIQFFIGPHMLMVERIEAPTH